MDAISVFSFILSISYPLVSIIFSFSYLVIKFALSETYDSKIETIFFAEEFVRSSPRLGTTFEIAYILVSVLA